MGGLKVGIECTRTSVRMSTSSVLPASPSLLWASVGVMVWILHRVYGIRSTLAAQHLHCSHPWTLPASANEREERWDCESCKTGANQYRAFINLEGSSPHARPLGQEGWHRSAAAKNPVLWRRQRYPRTSESLADGLLHFVSVGSK